MPKALQSARVSKSAVIRALLDLGFSESGGYRGSHVVFQNRSGLKVNSPIGGKKETSIQAVSMTGQDLQRLGICSRNDFVRACKMYSGKIPTKPKATPF